MKQRIIIIGGMGPQASLLLHKRLIDGAIDRGARDGGDFPEIIHASLPIDDFISDETKTIKAFEAIKAALECLYPWRQRSYCTGM